MARRATPAKYHKKKQSRVGLFVAAFLLICGCAVGIMEWLEIPLPQWLSRFGPVQAGQSQVEMPVTGTVPEGALTVHFIDVGQGDCALVQCGGENLLIDAGDPGNEEVILSYLDSVQVTRLDYVIATHPHADHIGSMSGVLSQVQEVGTVILPEIPEERPLPHRPMKS